MKLTIIGDVHGKIDRYKEIIDKCDFSICVGDFGFKKEWDWLETNRKDKNGIQSHYVNMGNHDYIPYCKYHTSCLGNHTNNRAGIFTVRGAESIDKHLRTEGLDWFPNEELNYQEQLKAFDKYVKVKPRIVISHDCPQSVLESIFKMGWTYGKSQTRTMLENMFQEHRPEYWFFGHHHESKDTVIRGTRFICLAELETFEITV